MSRSPDNTSIRSARPRTATFVDNVRLSKEQLQCHGKLFNGE